ncbi:unnamed protein product [Cuscuta europaea]|uniref:Uncharacterized protein n=1 Tax=Cuscuta europaea TaxID=41803 RepID=A0A9P0YWU6_CUSEU|nr:unnamed protein product [Cuscuta europaea]
MYALTKALALAQNPLSDEDLVINILNGLGPEYSELTSAIRVRETALPLTQLQDILLEQEGKIQENVSSTSDLLPTAHATQTHDRSYLADSRLQQQHVLRGSFSRSGRGGHHQNTSRSAATSLTCRFCDNIGHEVKHCRKTSAVLT